MTMMKTTTTKINIWLPKPHRIYQPMQPWASCLRHHLVNEHLSPLPLYWEVERINWMTMIANEGIAVYAKRIFFPLAQETL
jgi:hypothetical protein